MQIDGKSSTVEKDVVLWPHQNIEQWAKEETENIRGNTEHENSICRSETLNHNILCFTSLMSDLKFIAF